MYRWVAAAATVEARSGEGSADGSTCPCVGNLGWCEVAANDGRVTVHDTPIVGSNPVYLGSELVLGLVAPVGTNSDAFENSLKSCLKEFTYETNVVRVSELMDAAFGVQSSPPMPSLTDEAKRIHSGMHHGNALRLNMRQGGVLALAAARKIMAMRASPGEPMRRYAHVIRSLKHPDEARALRRIYGAGFYLLGITQSEASRRDYLKNRKNCTDDEITTLFERDEDEQDPDYFHEGTNYGQQTRDTFHLADAFVPMDDESELRRFLKLIFAHPYTTPEPDEYHMFLAYAASLRSADLSRQVGAVLVDEHGDVIGIGANDVPAADGGQYWPGPADRRDHFLGVDSNQQHREEIVTDMLRRIAPRRTEGGEEIPDESWIKEQRGKLTGARINDITEYGRPVHAEMAAVSAAARAGASTRRGTLYCTTFPCHNCAKHLIAAGLRRVVYVEPYPKSQALALFKDSLALGQPITSEDPTVRRVGFQAFVGVGPRRFFDLFSLSLSTGMPVPRKVGGRTIDWDATTAELRVPMLPNMYLDRELVAENELKKLVQDQEQVQVVQVQEEQVQ